MIKGSVAKFVILGDNCRLNHLIEQDHRFIKKITKPMMGFSFSQGDH
jgi:transposase-like protein